MVLPVHLAPVILTSVITLGPCSWTACDMFPFFLPMDSHPFILSQHCSSVCDHSPSVSGDSVICLWSSIKCRGCPWSSDQAACAPQLPCSWSSVLLNSSAPKLQCSHFLLALFYFKATKHPGSLNQTLMSRWMSLFLNGGFGLSCMSGFCWLLHLMVPDKGLLESFVAGSCGCFFIWSRKSRELLATHF